MNALRLLPQSLCFTALLIGAANPDFARAADLPSGNGFAAAFENDREIASHPAVIFTEDFEGADYQERWDNVRNDNGDVLSRVKLEDAAARFGHSLKVTAVLDRNTGGGLTQWFESADAVFIRFYTRFAPESDYIHHFVTLRANMALEGRDKWSGFGGAGSKPEGDVRFSTALEPWGNWGNWPAPGRWNFYSYWHEMEVSRDGKYWGNGFRPEEQENIPKDRWICAEFMLKHNMPGEADGEQAYWIDGELKGHWTGINWRTSENLKANALTLETYVTDRWTENKTNVVYFDNLVIARKYIGPMGAAE